MNDTVLPSIASVSDFQRNYLSLINKAKKDNKPLMILRSNKLEAVLLNTELFQDLARKARLYEEKQALTAISNYKRDKQNRKLKKMKSISELFNK